MREIVGDEERFRDFLEVKTREDVLLLDETEEGEEDFPVVDDEEKDQEEEEEEEEEDDAPDWVAVLNIFDAGEKIRITRNTLQTRRYLRNIKSTPLRKNKKRLRRVDL